MAARAEQPIDQAASDQPAPAPKSTKQKSAKTTAKKPVSRDSANKEQHHAKAVAAPETKDQAVASNEEPATGDVQEAPSAGAFPNQISKLRELFGGVLTCTGGALGSEPEPAGLEEIEDDQAKPERLMIGLEADVEPTPSG